MGVLNGRGLRSYPNPGGPNPAKRPEPCMRGAPSTVQYVGHMQTGTVQFTDVADMQQLEAWSKEVLANTPYRDEKLDDAGTPAGNPVPRGRAN